MIDLKAWLETITDPDGAPMFRKPWWWLARGVTVATDGRMLVTVRNKYSDDEPDQKTMIALASILDKPDAPESETELDAVALKEWAGSPRKEVETDCGCKDGKKSCDCGDGKCVCDCCDDEHDCAKCYGTAKVKCEDCDGGKVLDWPEPRRGWIAGVLVDRGRVAALIEPMEGSVIKLTTVPLSDGRALRATQGGVSILLTEMQRSSYDTETYPAFPDKGENES